MKEFFMQGFLFLGAMSLIAIIACAVIALCLLIRLTLKNVMDAKGEIDLYDEFLLWKVKHIANGRRIED